MAEWLRRLTRNQIPSGSVGSNPTDCAKTFLTSHHFARGDAIHKDWRNHFFHLARLAQSVEHETLNLRVVGSSPTLGDQTFFGGMGDSQPFSSPFIQTRLDWP